MAQRILRHCNCHRVLYTNSQHEDLQNKQALPLLTTRTCTEATTGPTSKEDGIVSCRAVQVCTVCGSTQEHQLQMWPQFPDKLCTLAEMKFTHRKVRKKTEKKAREKDHFQGNGLQFPYFIGLSNCGHTLCQLFTSHLNVAVHSN